MVKALYTHYKTPKDGNYTFSLTHNDSHGMVVPPTAMMIWISFPHSSVTAAIIPLMYPSNHLTGTRLGWEQNIIYHKLLRLP